jgi:predicted nuclease of restriction endonuclease-like (RecB) superfamily
MKKTKSAQPTEFVVILDVIHEGRARAFTAVNVALIETYAAIGSILSRKVQDGGWGKGVIRELADWISQQTPDLKGFSASNLWRMMQFHYLWTGREKLAPLVRELSWSCHMVLMGQCKTHGEQDFYLAAAVQGRWSRRGLESQIRRGAFERTALADRKTPRIAKERPLPMGGVFKDSYTLDFLDLPDQHFGADLQASIVANLRKFLLELGNGFTYVGEKVRLQVGQRDFEIDLLFYHRDLRCLVAFELKTGAFEPEHLGQLSFYLEALDRDHRRPHENPSIGVLLCRRKDDEVVEYALNRTLSPAVVAEYETKLVPRDLLRRKLHEWSHLLERDTGVVAGSEDRDA